MSTQLAMITKSYDGDLPQQVEMSEPRAESTQSVGVEFYFKDVLFTQETAEFIL